MLGADLQKLAKWIAIIVFFLVVPAAVLYGCDKIVLSLGNSSTPNDIAKDFDVQLPSILLAFYSGGVGAIVAYIYARVQGIATSEPLIYQMAKLLFGGLMGVAGLFFLRSNALIKLLYPKIPTDSINNQDASSSSLMMIAFLGGLLGPYLVKAAQERAASKTKELNKLAAPKADVPTKKRDHAGHLSE
jgi:hypothetical protein